MSFPEGDSFEATTIADVAATGADLGGRELVKCTIRNAKLDETRWARTRLEDCVFENCDLTRADVASLALRDVTFKSCKLMGNDFSKIAKHSAMTFVDCNLRYATFVGMSLKKLVARDCAFHEASFIDVDLTAAQLADCNFTGALFERCTLAKAAFPEAANLFIDPAKNSVKGALVPVETAVVLATALGFRVIGYTDE